MLKVVCIVGCVCELMRHFDFKHIFGYFGRAVAFTEVQVLGYLSRLL